MKEPRPPPGLAPEEPDPATESKGTGPTSAPEPEHLRLASLYVGDLSQEVTESTLHGIFSECGNVVLIRVCRDRVSRRSLGYAYVNYAEVPDAEKALSTLNYTSILGRPCRIMWARKAGEKQDSLANIFVKNLDLNIDAGQLHDTFQIFGPILTCKVATDAAGKSLGHGFIQFENAKDASAAIESANGKKIGDCVVYVGAFVSRSGSGKEQTRPPTSRLPFVSAEFTDEQLSTIDRIHAERFTDLYVTRFPDSFDEVRLKKIFSDFGSVSSVMLKKSGKGRPYAMVCYQDSTSAKKAVDELHDKPLSEIVRNSGRATTGAEQDGGGCGPKVGAEEIETQKPPGGAVADGCGGAADGSNVSEDSSEPKDPDSTGGTGAGGTGNWRKERLFVQRAQHNGERERERKQQAWGEQERRFRLNVSGMKGPELSETGLRKLFEAYGPIRSVEVVKDRGGKGKG